MAATDGRDEAPGPPVQLLLGAIGVGLLASGVVAAFVQEDGVTTAALLSAGFAMVFVGYLGRYITKIRFREFEAELNGLQRKVKETERALRDLEAAARKYESIRASMRPGGLRDDEMDGLLAQATELARAAGPSKSELERLLHSRALGDRIEVLAAMKAHPDLRDPGLVMWAIENFCKPFDHDRFLLLAGEMWHTFTPEQRKELVDLIQRQRQTGKIKEDKVRWASSERIMRLMERHDRAQATTPERGEQGM